MVIDNSCLQPVNDAFCWSGYYSCFSMSPPPQPPISVLIHSRAGAGNTGISVSRSLINTNKPPINTLTKGYLHGCFIHGFRGHSGVVVTHSPATSEVCGSNPVLYVGTLVVAHRWSAVYSTVSWLTVFTGFLCPQNYPSWYDLYSVDSDVKPQINKYTRFSWRGPLYDKLAPWREIFYKYIVKTVLSITYKTQQSQILPPNGTFSPFTGTNFTIFLHYKCHIQTQQQITMQCHC